MIYTFRYSEWFDKECCGEKRRSWYNGSALHKAVSALRHLWLERCEKRSPQARKILVITSSASSWYEVPHRSSSLTINLYANSLRELEGKPPRQCVSYGCLHCYYCATKWHQMSEVIFRVAVFALISKVCFVEFMTTSDRISIRILHAMRLNIRKYICDPLWFHSPWWRHQMETVSALLAFCAGNSASTGENSPHKVTQSFDVFFDLRLN